MGLFNNDDDFIPYKFKHVKTYSSAEWMANSTKKYRSVFDRQELTYLRAEFTFYNKWFDEKDWKAKICLKLISVNENNKELCSLDQELEIKMDQNEVTIHEGWGNATAGVFFKKGTYTWNAYIDDKLVGSGSALVNDVGVVSESINPYLSIEKFMFFEDGKERTSGKDKIYYSEFQRDTTRYVWTEFHAKIETQLDFNYEFFVNYFDNANQLKGQTFTSGKIEADNLGKTFIFEVGWGNENKLSWVDDCYRVDVIFNDVCIASGIYNVGYQNIEGSPTITKGISTSTVTEINSTESEEAQKAKNLEELLAELDGLVGLDRVKKEVRETINYVEFAKMRREKGFNDSGKMNLHSVFLGNPGTGKTTVARMLGKIYNAMGVLSKGHVVEVDRAALIGEYIGQTAPKVKKAIEEARGGVLFIDEAYALTPPDNDKDFGREAIEILMKEMSDGAGDIAIFCAGYTAEMNNFINFNPGLKSRFNQFFHFEDYVPEELMKISNYACEKHEVTLTPEAQTVLVDKLTRLFRDRNKSFGNARLVNSLISEAKMNLADRIMKTKKAEDVSREDLEIITEEDMQMVFLSDMKKSYHFTIDEALLSRSLDELNLLVGMNGVKEHINKMVKLIRFYNETGKDVLSKISLHTVFTGNPGTGKTTVARILAKIYNALGLLESGQCVEVDKSGLIAEYTGQTAQKTLQAIESAMGGVLFIDEAYALNDGTGQFGNEAIEVILKQMEDKRGKFAVFAAGYTNNMNQFLAMNPGLKSRFNEILHFEDYGPSDLIVIAENSLAVEDLKMDVETRLHVLNYLTQLYEMRDQHFGNARVVREMVEDIVTNQHLRLAELSSDQRTTAELTQVKLIDVQNLKVEPKNEGGRSKIGF